jgi:hypothetical protein
LPVSLRSLETKTVTDPRELSEAKPEEPQGIG